jgi:nucleoside-diphosphate-sugar epimerase
MIICITGVSGLVGSHLARRLLAEGHQVKALRRASTSLKLVADIAHQIEWAEGDLLDVLTLEPFVASADIVIHAAAHVSFAPNDRELMYKVNIDGTSNIVNTCLQASSLKKFVHISSIAAIGRSKDSLHIDEQTKWEHSDENTHYAITKYLSELEVWRGSEEGLPVLILNPSIILGGGDWHSGSTALFKYIHDRKPFYPKGNLNYVDIADITACVMKLINSPLAGERFILNGGNVPYKQFMQMVADQWKIPAPRYPVTKFMAAVAWRFEWIKSLFTGKTPLITRETARMSGKNYIYNAQKIQTTAGLSFTPLQETVERVCKELAERKK